MSALRVFVYGTLKRQEPNHHLMTSSSPADGTAEFVGSAVTQQRYPLVVLPPYFIPYCLDLPGEGHQLQGEVYAIDEAKLKRLDILESYPERYTRRLEEVSVTCADDKDAAPMVLKAWMYIKRQHTERHLQYPMLDNYSDSENKYVPKSGRTQGPDAENQ